MVVCVGGHGHIPVDHFKIAFGAISFFSTTSSLLRHVVFHPHLLFAVATSSSAAGFRPSLPRMYPAASILCSQYRHEINTKDFKQSHWCFFNSSNTLVQPVPLLNCTLCMTTFFKDRWWGKSWVLIQLREGMEQYCRVRDFNPGFRDRSRSCMSVCWSWWMRREIYNALMLSDRLMIFWYNCRNRGGIVVISKQSEQNMRSISRCSKLMRQFSFLDGGENASSRAVRHSL